MPIWLSPEQRLPEMQATLLDWFAHNKRDLPWRRTYSPYAVWISEIMLQQTQMQRGVAYFERWMARFPDIPALASAPEDEILRLWEGLGYYSRARNVLKAAHIIMAEHGGRFPDSVDDIRALPGVGPYTAAAIASIAFQADIPCIDANVERVIARVFDIDVPVKQEPAASRICQLAQDILPTGKAREHNQAMMELGALVCGKKPRCVACPLAPYCTSLHLGIVDERPVPGKRATITAIDVVTGVLWHQGRIFVQKRLPKGVWGNLWEFPGGCIEPGETPEQAIVREHKEETGFDVKIAASYGTIRHGYTTHRITLHCFRLSLDSAEAMPTPPVLTAATECRWVTPAELAQLPMPAAHRKLADQIGL